MVLSSDMHFPSPEDKEDKCVCLMLMILLISVDVNQILTLFCCVLRSLSADCVDDIRTAVPVKHWSVSRAPVESSALEQILDPSCSI